MNQRISQSLNFIDRLHRVRDVGLDCIDDGVIMARQDIDAAADSIARMPLRRCLCVIGRAAHPAVSRKASRRGLRGSGQVVRSYKTRPAGIAAGAFAISIGDLPGIGERRRDDAGAALALIVVAAGAVEPVHRRLVANAPQKLAGRSTEPITWVPRPALMMPAPTAAAMPLLEPPGVRCRSCGLRCRADTPSQIRS